MPDVEEQNNEDRDREAESRMTTYSEVDRSKWVACFILLLVNLLNYMDRFTIVGVMDRLKDFFDMNEKDSGLLQTVFIGFYMIFAPLCGYLGDRYNRKSLMICGITIWILAVFLSSFCGRDHYRLFLLCRGIVGIGEASYSTVAPTVLSDLFSGTQRSQVYMMFYFAIPVGSGLGFISGSRIALLTDSWQWGVRFTPIIGILCLVLMAVRLREPARGQSEAAHFQLHDGVEPSIWQDLKYLRSVRTYYLLCIASIASFFSIGTMSWWTPAFVEYASGVINKVEVVPKEEVAHINLVFGIITCASGLLGVAVGSLVSRAWKEGRSVFRHFVSKKADVYICAISMFLALPFLFSAIVVAEYSVNGCLVLVFFAIMSMCLNWAVNVDVLMYVVMANRRAMALAIQTLVAHMFGDAFSPYLIGALADWFRGDDASTHGKFFALQKALYMPTFMLVVAGAFFLAATFFVELDREEAIFQMDAQDRWNNQSPQARLHDDEAPLMRAGGYPQVVDMVVEEPAPIMNFSPQSSDDSA